ncbi:MAG: hypothetical protein Greene041614_426 [Parcubacteria group bacterium Greene0416_14]|nr:MAG: hypothetical protein Greene041614_426 [Parcubacteria group bacterium Greene0416_14]
MGGLTDIFAAPALILLILPIVLLDEFFGIPLYSSGYIFPIPTVLGYIVNIAVSLLFFYLIGSIVSKTWYKLKSKRLKKLPPTD